LPADEPRTAAKEEEQNDGRLRNDEGDRHGMVEDVPDRKQLGGTGRAVGYSGLRDIARSAGVVEGTVESFCRDVE